MKRIFTKKILSGASIPIIVMKMMSSKNIINGNTKKLFWTLSLI